MPSPRKVFLTRLPGLLRLGRLLQIVQVIDQRVRQYAHDGHDASDLLLGREDLPRHRGHVHHDDI